MKESRYILYADDDYDDIEIMKEVFQSFPGCQLLTFSTGIEILSYLNGLADHQNISLIILDINMHKVNGVEVLSRLKRSEALHHIPVVLYSTGGSPADKAVALDWDVDIVRKPSSYTEVEGAIRELLKRCKDPL